LLAPLAYGLGSLLRQQLQAPIDRLEKPVAITALAGQGSGAKLVGELARGGLNGPRAGNGAIKRCREGVDVGPGSIAVGVGGVLLGCRVPAFEDERGDELGVLLDLKP